jgi:2Fe-2S ferredoxin
MPKIVFVHPDGRNEAVEAEIGCSVMNAAMTHGIAGIIADCGGSAVCATCHVYVDEAWLEKTGGAHADEEALLDCAASGRLRNSRLSCQVMMAPELDGIRIRLPERQT